MKLHPALAIVPPALAGLAVWACASSAPYIQNAAQAADVAAYSADLDDCVAGSATRVQALQCMAVVRQQWCGPGGRLQVQGGCGDAGPESATPLGPTLTLALERFYGGTDAGGEQ